MKVNNLLLSNTTSLNSEARPSGDGALALASLRQAAREEPRAATVRPITVLRFWTSECLTQAES